MANNYDEKYTAPGSADDPEGSKIPKTPGRIPKPEWYKDNIDTYPDIATELDTRDELVLDGYVLEDSDKAKSSINYNEAVLNNSFSTDSIRKTLKKFYSNSFYKLTASNMDNTHFQKWEGYISDAVIPAHPEYISLRLPWDAFIYPERRNRFKLSQFYHKWLSVEEIANNRETFHFMILMFVNQQIFSDYEVWVEEQYVVLRFPYNKLYVEKNYPLYVYKFDTNFSARIKISRELCDNQWNWRMPVSYCEDHNLSKQDRVIVAINHMDGDTRGDNLEFLPVDRENGYIDLSVMSEFNINLVRSKFNEFVWMTIITPKFFHEYTQLLPTDVLYRPYVPDIYPVSIQKNSIPTHVKIDMRNDLHDTNNVFVDYNDFYIKDYDGWIFMTRPIILSDSGHEFKELYDILQPEIDEFTELTYNLADHIYEFKTYMMQAMVEDNEILRLFTIVETDAHALYDFHANFLDRRMCPRYVDFEERWEAFFNQIEEIKNQQSDYDIPDDFYAKSNQIDVDMHTLFDPYTIGNTVRAVQKEYLWQKPELSEDVVRYYRPISSNEFWIFKYDMDKHVWRPDSQQVEHHYPDVYVLHPPENKAVDHDAVYKVFFFYSDTMNVRVLEDEVIDNIPQYDAEFEAHAHKNGYLFDIFIKKFYWMGLEFVYKGLLETGSKWELVEYIKDNPGYRRYNSLFIKTIEPHYKLGLATYLKSDNVHFPFDDAIAKMKEAIQLEWHGYDRISNYQLYLDNHWEESYFDYIIRILNDVEVDFRNVKRHDLMFDLSNVRFTLQNTYNFCKIEIDLFLRDLQTIVVELESNGYSIDKELVQQLMIALVDFEAWQLATLEYIDSIDKPIMNLGEVKVIIDILKTFKDKVINISGLTLLVQTDIVGADVVLYKVRRLLLLESIMNDELIPAMDELIYARQQVDLNRYIQSCYDIIDYFNEFRNPWSYELQDYRTAFLEAFWELMNYKNQSDIFGISGVNHTIELFEIIKEKFEEFVFETRMFWNANNIEHDQTLLNLFDMCGNTWNEMLQTIPIYLSKMENVTTVISSIQIIMLEFDATKFTPEELSYYNTVADNIAAVQKESQYLNGVHDITMYSAFYSLKLYVVIWLEYLGIEAEVFDTIRILILTFLHRLETFQFYSDNDVRLTIQYMETSDDEFIPDDTIIDYLSIWIPTSWEPVAEHKGFHYKVDEHLYTDGMGHYNIEAILENGEVAAISPLVDYHNIYFKDPVRDQNYYTMTGGAGLNKFLVCTNSDRTYIVNDEIAVSTIAKILNFATDVRRMGSTINPHSNTDILNTLDRIPGAITEWENKIIRFENNMSPNIMNAINDAIIYLDPLAVAARKLVTERSLIDLSGLISGYRTLINLFKSADKDVEWVDPLTQILFRTLEENYEMILKFYGRGRSWSNQTELLSLLSTMELRLREVESVLSSQPPDQSTYVDEVQGLIDQLYGIILNIKTGMTTIVPFQDEIRQIETSITNILEPLDYKSIQGDEWWKIDEVFVAELGTGYVVGDLVVATDLNLIFQVTRVDVADGSVIKVRALGPYAIHKLVWGYFQTTTIRGIGTGLSLDIHSKSVKSDGAGVAEDSYIPDPDQYRNQDLMKFKFQNIHDLDMNYEIFAGGIQIVDFEQRHEDNVHIEPRKLDVLYINSNIINNLKNSNLYIKPDQYFIYKIDGFVIKDPGAGFHVEQDVYLDADHYCLKLNVSKLVYHPYKGIEEFDLVSGQLIYERDDPGGEDFPTVPDVQNNIDDEFHVADYDFLTDNGRPRPEAYIDEERYDDLEDDDRNKYFQYRHVDMPDNMYPLDKYIGNGDPNFHYYLGDRMDNSFTGEVYDHWLGIVDVEDLVYPQIEDFKRIPPGQDINGEFQLIDRQRFFHGFITPPATREVPTRADLPTNNLNFPTIERGDTIAVTADETHGHHRWIYTIILKDYRGNLFYDDGIIADGSWNNFNIDWMNIDSYPDMPSYSVQYPGVDWQYIPTYQEAIDLVGMRLLKQRVIPDPINHTAYIHNLRHDDISVFNWTEKRWENLFDTSRWKLEVRDDPANKDWGFKLTFLLAGDYDIDFKLYLNKVPTVQQRNQKLVKPAIVDIYSTIIDEVIIPEQRIEVNTSRATRIRKLFPYYQAEEYTLNGIDKTEMVFDFPPYMHYRNEIHPEDIVIFNKTTNQFENPLNDNMWEIQIKDPNRNDLGKEKRAGIKEMILTKSGDSYANGQVYGWNEDYTICIFGEVTADIARDGQILTFEILSIVNRPVEGQVDFMLYQNQSSASGGMVFIDFETTEHQVSDDGYIHGVLSTQSLAPIKEGFKLVPKYSFPIPYEYEISIRKTTTKQLYILPEWTVTPTFNIPGESFPADRFYILINNRRFPLVNCSTRRPSLEVKREVWGNSVQFLNLYKKWEHFEIRTLPYATRSVYVQRKIPSHGYINLWGKLNKPLDKKHYEFWVNGKLLYDEVNIITPSKIFLHGLTSLKNLEILEINRSFNEYFSDDLLECYIDEDNPIPKPQYNLRTYLDDVLEGKLPDNNYTLAEQEKLITPVWKQVARDHLDYMDYPENVDSDRDILLRVYSPEDLPLPDLPGGSYQYLVIDCPTIEGYVLDQRNLKWEGTGWRPIQLQTIVDLYNDEFKDQIKYDPYLDPFVIITEDIWYGVTANMYDEYGILTHDLNAACYTLYDDSLLSINVKEQTVHLDLKEPDIDWNV